MEEVLMAARHLWKNEQVPNGYTIAADCENILHRAGIILPGEKAIIGKKMYSHTNPVSMLTVLSKIQIYMKRSSLKKLV